MFHICKKKEKKKERLRCKLQITKRKGKRILGKEEVGLDDGGAEEALEVAAAGELEARYNFFGDGGATYDMASFENGNGETSASQICGGCQSVMAGTDYQRVPFLLPQCVRPAGAATATEAPSPHFLFLSQSPVITAASVLLLQLQMGG